MKILEKEWHLTYDHLEAKGYPWVEWHTFSLLCHIWLAILSSSPSADYVTAEAFMTSTSTWALAGAAAGVAV